MGEKRSTFWTGCQSIGGQHADGQDKQYAHTLKGNSIRPVNQQSCFSTAGGISVRNTYQLVKIGLVKMTALKLFILQVCLHIFVLLSVWIMLI